MTSLSNCDRAEPPEGEFGDAAFDVLARMSRSKPDSDAPGGPTAVAPGLDESAALPRDELLAITSLSSWESPEPAEDAGDGADEVEEGGGALSVDEAAEACTATAPGLDGDDCGGRTGPPVLARTSCSSCESPDREALVSPPPGAVMTGTAPGLVAGAVPGEPADVLATTSRSSCVREEDPPPTDPDVALGPRPAPDLAMTSRSSCVSEEEAAVRLPPADPGADWTETAPGRTAACEDDDDLAMTSLSSCVKLPDPPPLPPPPTLADANGVGTATAPG